ncbi:hypothetical protein E2C01_085213 [Portunus trituberculatus]|uniref:Uncharacterized protein n=1 Tax=Portunus trituberculatus TaxID=210409 RepID=A0A5B7J9V0_PORTR|nr:hypothetical protein [Portunus trituberculatus]
MATQETQDKKRNRKTYWTPTSGPAIQNSRKKYSRVTSPQLAAPSKPEMLLGGAIVRRCLPC